MSSETSTPSRSSPGVQLAGIGKRFGFTVALSGVDLAIEPGACQGLIGSSGSGKTTLLRIVAGLEQPDCGSVRFYCREGSEAVPRPKIGMVFQNLGLWPHLTARQHVACVQEAARAADQAAVESLLDEVRLPRGAWDRRPNQLSGGEGQRVALARALACQPQLLLLDEPLAHLDVVLRTELLEQVSQVIRRRRITAIYVTHAWAEAAVFCTRIGVLQQGRLQQEGTPEELFWRPANEVVARMTGPLITLPRTWLAEGKVASDPQLPTWAGLATAASDHVWLRPQQLRITAAEGASRWRVAACRPFDAGWLVELSHEAGHCLSFLTAAAAAPGECAGLRLAAAPQAKGATKLAGAYCV